MGPLLSHVADLGRGAATAANRVWNIPGNAGRMGVDKLEDSTYKFLSRNAGDRAENIAQKIYSDPKFARPDDSDLGKAAFDRIRDTQYANLDDRARFQAALIPGGLRFAGRAAVSPLAKTGYTVVATLGAGNMLEEQAQREQLQAMGLDPEQAELLANELALAAQNMEPMYV